MSASFSVPDLCLVLLIGPSGSGKSYFATKFFSPTQIVSSDLCRAMISDDANNQECSAQAFELVAQITQMRLNLGKLTVVDATHLKEGARQKMVQIARKNHVPVIAIVFEMSLELCLQRNKQRIGRQVPEEIVTAQYQDLQKFILHQKSSKTVHFEGFAQIQYVRQVSEIDQLKITYRPLETVRSDMQGPFDIIGDVHGCADELCELIAILGYQLKYKPDAGYQITHPEGRKLVFVGDLTDRGPKSDQVLKMVMDFYDQNMAISVTGNHDDKLWRYLKGQPIKIAHGLQSTLDQISEWSDSETERLCAFLENLPAYYLLDSGKLTITHAGIKQSYLGRLSPRIRRYCLYGPVTNELDEYGYVKRLDWARDYDGESLVIYGHTPVSHPRWVHQSVNLDTGCVFGGALTALRYPELELKSVHAHHAYYHKAIPFMQTAETEKR